MYDSVHEWEARERERERERERFPHPITQQMSDPLKHDDIVNFYEEDTSLRGNSTFLKQLIHHEIMLNRHLAWVQIHGINSRRTTSILSPGYLRGGMIGPSCLSFLLAL